MYKADIDVTIDNIGHNHEHFKDCTHRKDCIYISKNT